MKTETTTERLLGRIAVAVEAIARELQRRGAEPHASVSAAVESAPSDGDGAFHGLAAEVGRLARGLATMTAVNAEALAARRELAEMRRQEMRAVLDELHRPREASDGD